MKQLFAAVVHAAQGPCCRCSHRGALSMVGRLGAHLSCRSWQGILITDACMLAKRMHASRYVGRRRGDAGGLALRA